MIDLPPLCRQPRLALCALACALWGHHAIAQTSAPASAPSQPLPAALQASPDVPTTRPKIGLVLSGGGARGLAHIGALRVLKEMHIPIDLVVGTSMGAVVGGAYAAGLKVEELENFARHADWDALLADRPPRQELAFRRREEDLLVPSRLQLGLNRQGFALPPSAAGNSALEFTLERLVAEGRGEWPVNQLALPFRSIATDLVSGEMTQLKDTPLFLAMRASAAVPGVFMPVRVDGRLVVDGGLVRNLGVDVAREMGADIVIAVNVGTPLLAEHEITSAASVANQMLQILTAQNVKQSISELTPKDVLITVKLDNLGFVDFKRYEDAMKAGKAAAQAAAPSLAALALPEALYAQLEAARQVVPSAVARSLPLKELNVSGTRHANPEALKVISELEPGKPVTLAQVNKAVANLYGTGEFDRIESRVRDADGERMVDLKVDETQWGRSRLRLGLELRSNLADSHEFTLVGMHVASLLNDWGGELRSIMKVGGTLGLESSFNQPLGAGSPWFLRTGFDLSSRTADLYQEGRARLRYNSTARLLDFSAGRTLGQWGEVRLGAQRVATTQRLVLPADPNFVPVTINSKTYYLMFRQDSLDNLSFPASGSLVNLTLANAQRLGGNEQDAALELVGMRAFRWGRWAGHVYGELSHSKVGQASSLGGFWRLSGTPNNAFDGGASMVFSRFVMARKVGEMPVGFGGDVRAGFSLEAGAAKEKNQAIKLPGVRAASSAFISIDTRFGPLYLAVGSTSDSSGASSKSSYLYLGPVW